jgi:hypothetical protein
MRCTPHFGKWTGTLALLCLTAAAHAQVAINPAVSFSNGLYTYNYDVVNNTAETLAITTFEVPALPGAILNLTAPTGFDISFDSGLGLVSFFEDTDPNTLDTFAAGSTVSGFMFSSFYAPGVSDFEALDVNGTSFIGTTRAPVVPEPGTFALFGGVTLGGVLALRRRRNSLH